MLTRFKSGKILAFTLTHDGGNSADNSAESICWEELDDDDSPDLVFWQLTAKISMPIILQMQEKYL